MVTCAGCAAQTPAAGRFCIECGTPLAAACASCGTPYTPGQRFCGSCGSPLGTGATSPAAPLPRPTPAAPVTPLSMPPRAPAPVAERRLVSILYADLVGFTPFAAERDADLQGARGPR